ncbi:MAG: hypothetical protein PHW64_09020 [Sulfuricurvum sp.]|nr:hypothetical protein [Sulfuricurvum sp.]
MRLLIAVFLFTLTLSAGVLTPKTTLRTSSPILDFVVHEGEVWAGTENGEILKISPKGKLLFSLKIPPITDSWGETKGQKIMSLDLSPDTKLLAVAGEDGSLYVARGGKITKTAYSTRTVIKKIAFFSDTRVVLALLSNEVVFFDLVTNKTLKTLNGGTSPLSDLALSSDRKLAAIAGEAGNVSLIDTGAMKIVKVIRGGNVDNIYKIDFKNAHIVTAGQDRRAIVYTQNGKSYLRFDGTFLIYAAALSPSASRMAAAMDEQNLITVFDVAKREKIATAKGHETTLNRIVFIDEKRFVSCADENKILFWEIP